MKLIVGLGNPGDKYNQTRHNLGFMVLDKIIEKIKDKNSNMMPFRLENQFEADITQTGGIGENRIVFAKPVTFMNNSGNSVSKLLSYYKIAKDDLLVISDDIDLPTGNFRIRTEGSSGGHKGVESIINQIGDNRFLRIKIGIGSNRNQNIPSEKYVLEKFPDSEQKIIAKVIDKTADLVLNWTETGKIKEETIKILF